MASKEEQQFNPDKLFDKFKEYFNYKFDSIAKSNKDTDESSVK